MLNAVFRPLLGKYLRPGEMVDVLDSVNRLARSYSVGVVGVRECFFGFAVRVAFKLSALPCQHTVIAP